MSTIEASLQLEIAQYQAALKKAQGDVERFRQKAQKTGDQLGGALFGGVAKRAAMLAPILGAGFGAKGVLDAVVNMERLEKMLVTTEGSAEKAAERMKVLQDIARLPGLDLEQAVRGDNRLRATGISAELSKKAIIEFSNALALVGGTADEFGGVINALSQISAKGKVFAEEINQIAERVPQIRKVLQEAFGTADTEAIQKMGLSTEEFFTSILGVMSQFQRAQRGLQDEFSEMGDIGKSLANDIGAPVVKTLIPAFTDLLEMLKENREELISLGSAMGEVAKVAVKAGGFGIKNGAALSKSVLQPGRLGLDLLGNVADAYGGGVRGVGARSNRNAKPVAAAPAGDSGAATTRVGEFVGPAAPTAAQRKKEVEDELRLQEQIAEIQRQARLDTMSAGERARALAREVSQLEKQAASETGVVAKLELEKQILQIKNEQRQAERQAVQETKNAAEEAKEEANRAAAAQQSLAVFQRELAIAEARAAGENDLADAMQRELDIQQLQARLMEEMKLSQDEALMLAERQVEAAAALNAEQNKNSRYDEEGRRADGRRQIKGYSQAQGDAAAARARALGRVDDARSRRQIPSGLDAFAAQTGLRDRMGTGSMFPGLTAAFGEPGAPLAETAKLNASAADKAGNGGARSLEDKLDRLIAISEQGLLGDG